MAAKAMKSFLQFLTELTLRQLKAVLSTVTRKQILALREVATNAIRGNLDLSEETLKKLKSFKKFLRDFAIRGVKRCVLSKRCKAIYLLLRATKEAIEEL